MPTFVPKLMTNISYLLESKILVVKFPRYYLMVWLFLLCTTGSQAQRLKICHIDVDQADATLFIAPNGSTLLVAAGENGKGRAIKKILDLEGINRIDYFVNTHYHKDHYGGIDELVNAGISVGIAYDRGDKGSLPSKKLGEDTLGTISAQWETVL